MARKRMRKSKKASNSSKVKKTLKLNNNTEQLCVSALDEKIVSREQSIELGQKTTYTFSSLFPNVDMLNRVHQIIRQLEYAK